MSLRPAQDLVEGSSKFSLRQFFEEQQPQQQTLLPLPIRSPADLSMSETGLPTLSAQQQGEHSPPGAAPVPFLRPHPPNGATTTTTTTTAAYPHKDGKFTFTGLMSATTPIQMQHKILQQHQQQALVSQGSVLTKPTALHADSTNELLRLKAQIVQLNDKLAFTNTNLTTTSESVVRGNKALTTERAQFHAKYASLSKRLEATQAALADAEALPKEDFKSNAKLLNAKVLELQLENEKLVATHAELEASLAQAEVAMAATARAMVQSGEEAPVANVGDLQEKFTSLSTQHSSLLNRHLELEEELEEKSTQLMNVEAELDAAIDRADAAEMQIANLKQQVEASQREIAQTDFLVDTLDEKLVAARTEPAEAAVPEVMVASCCPATMRCEAMEQAARDAHGAANGASAHESKQLHQEWQFLDRLARRARHALDTGEQERVMVAHVYTGDAANASEERVNLSEQIAVQPRPMGKPIDDSCLHCAVDVGADLDVVARDAATVEGRTNAFVNAVSKDLKFSMDGSQALYASSSTTGVALRI